MQMTEMTEIDDPRPADQEAYDVVDDVIRRAVAMMAHDYEVLAFRVFPAIPERTQ